MDVINTLDHISVCRFVFICKQDIVYVNKACTTFGDSAYHH
jgi:hypothetical protein